MSCLPHTKLDVRKGRRWGTEVDLGTIEALPIPMSCPFRVLRNTYIVHRNDPKACVRTWRLYLSSQPSLQLHPLRGTAHVTTRILLNSSHNDHSTLPRYYHYHSTRREARLNPAQSRHRGTQVSPPLLKICPHDTHALVPQPKHCIANASSVRIQSAQVCWPSTLTHNVLWLQPVPCLLDSSCLARPASCLARCSVSCLARCSASRLACCSASCLERCSASCLARCSASCLA